MTPSVRKDVILVVDDSPDSLGMIHHALDQAGLTALVALEGEQAAAIRGRCARADPAGAALSGADRVGRLHK